MTEYKIMWTLEEAVDFLRHLEPALREAGWTSGLGGSVLLKGASTKDLDVFVVPMSTAEVSRPALYAALLKKGLTCKCDRVCVTRTWMRNHHKDTPKGEPPHHLDSKHVELWNTPEGKRVDVFILQ